MMNGFLHSLKVSPCKFFISFHGEIVSLQWRELMDTFLSK